MDSALVMSINLPGRLGTRVEHTTYQKYTVDTIDDKTHRPITITRNILHTNRKMTPCVKEVEISPLVVKNWTEGPCPYWINLKLWKKFNNDQKIATHVARFDEGYGVSYS